MIDLLHAADLIHLNERIVRQQGALASPIDEEALAALVDQFDASAPLAELAAGYLHALLTQQPFPVSNAGTALLAARTLILLNDGAFHRKLKQVPFADGLAPKEKATGEALWLTLIFEVSSGQLSLPALQEWFRRNTTA